MAMWYNNNNVVHKNPNLHMSNLRSNLLLLAFLALL